MPALVIPDAMQVVIKGVNLGTEWVNVWGIVNESPFLMDQSVADEIADAFFDAYALNSTAYNAGFSLDAIEVRDLRTATSPAWDAVIPGFSGSNASNALPPQLAAVISHKTAFRGSSYRGRTYMGGFTEDSNEGDGTIAAATRTALAALPGVVQGGLDAMSIAGFELAVLSRKLLVATPIVSSSVDDEWDRQTRRKRE